MKKYFPSDRLTTLDYLIGGCLLLVCYLSFFHKDIWNSGFDSLSFLSGKPLDFYDNAAKLHPGWVNYPPTVYALFALWLSPFKLLGLVKSGNLPLYLVYWLKALTTLAYLLSGFVFYKIVREYQANEQWARFAALLWLTTPLAMFSQFIFSQYDIFYVLLTLLGFLLFLRGKLLQASAVFGLAITFKYFPAFTFIPLLLLFEKKMGRILAALSLFAAPTLLIRLLYGRSPAFVENVLHYGTLDRVYYAALDIALGWQVYLLFASFGILCCAVYVADVGKDRLPHTAAYVFLVASILPFLLFLWHPQWVMCFAPAIILTTVIGNRTGRFLPLDLVAMVLYIAFISFSFPDNVDAALFRTAYLGSHGMDFHNTYFMSAYFKFFGEHSSNVYLSLFWAYLASQLALKFKLAAVAPTATDHSVDYSKVRYRFYLGLLIFLIPASISIFKDHRLKSRAIINQVAGGDVGELTNNRVFEQSFVAIAPQILALDLQLSTLDRENDGTLVVEVVSDSPSRTLGRAEVSLDSVKDNLWRRVIFKDPIVVTKGDTYRIRLTSPTAQSGNAITWLVSKTDAYPNGRAFVDGVPRDADFCFRVWVSKW